MANALIRLVAHISTRAPKWDDDRGASLVEYALLVVLIAVVCAIAIGVLGTNLKSSYSSAGSGWR